jgi:hypothetical protein
LTPPIRAFREGDQLLNIQPVAVCHDSRSFDTIIQFTDVSRPVVVQESIHRVATHTEDLFLVSTVKSLYEVVHETGDILLALP